MTTTRPGILVLCTGNSARSQMAEAILRREVGDRYAVYSAGTEPAERVNPLAIEVMEEAGYDLAGHHSKHLRQFLGRVPIHTLIIVCDGAAQSCPAIWPGAFERLLWPLPDPAAVTGPLEHRRSGFRAVRDELLRRVGDWVATLPAPAGARR